MTASKAAVIGTLVELRDDLALRRRAGQSIGLVPTMGALHEGHLSLIKAATARDDTVVVSVFVNPTQFGSATDLASYPRDLARDVDLAERAGASLVFAPTVEEMYPHGPTDVTVDPGSLAHLLEGASRPGHFRGVATIVTKLFAGIAPTRAYFGEKDYQQLLLIEKIVADLSFGIEVVRVPTVRAPDGLALSSRNARLADASRANALYQALLAGAQQIARGASGEQAEVAMRAVIERDAGIELDYAVARDGRSLGPIDPQTSDVRLLIAAVIDGVRLIDNIDARDGAT